MSHVPVNFQFSPLFLQVRTSAVTYLQRALLVPDLQVLSPLEWEGCFHRVLFPLLGELLAGSGANGIGPISGLEETRMRAATLLSKVFLQHLTPLLALPTFAAGTVNVRVFATGVSTPTRK